MVKWRRLGRWRTIFRQWSEEQGEEEDRTWLGCEVHATSLHTQPIDNSFPIHRTIIETIVSFHYHNILFSVLAITLHISDYKFVIIIE